jgi:hypothetical protein
MARRKIKIMISSRCNDRFPANGGASSRTLSEIRAQLKKEVEAEKLLEKEPFEVWINEDEPSEPGSKDSWELCINQAREADILLVLYNGNAGWSLSQGDIGICHAEFMTAFSESSGKVSVVSLLDNDKQLRPAGQQNERFQAYVDQTNLFRGASVASPDDVIRAAKGALRETILNLAHQGAREVKRSRYNAGPALDWSRLDFFARQKAMRDAVVDALAVRDRANRSGAEIVLPVAGKKVLFLSHAIPAAISIPAAREMVGQPFLKDHLSAPILKTVAGPVHVIACHKSVTESQAMTILGFPDATIVTGSFGVYVADNVQNIQLCLIANCRDESSTRHGLQKLFDWLVQTGEDTLLATRAASRSRIVGAVAKESAL